MLLYAHRLQMFYNNPKLGNTKKGNQDVDENKWKNTRTRIAKH